MNFAAQRRAVIDVGTNSVKVLVGDLTPDGTVTPVLETSEQTRLGRDFYSTHRLHPEPIANTARAVRQFATLAREHGAHHLRLIATSAARDAENRAELVSALETAAGVAVEVISGETEAEWAFAGVCSALGLTHRRILVLDVGGGSTEFILGAHAHTEFRHSFQLGSVRLFERLRLGDAPSLADLVRARTEVRGFLRREAVSKLKPHLEMGPPERVFGVGGSTAILALVQAGNPDFDRELVERTRFSRFQLSGLVERLWSLPLTERRQLPGLPPERADVILTGAVIYEAVLEEFQFPELAISTRGLRFAALAEA